MKLHYYRGEYREALRRLRPGPGRLGVVRPPARRGRPRLLPGPGPAGPGRPRTPARRPADLEAAREHLATLDRWRLDCEANFGHKALLVEAELARVEGRDADALRLFDEAARSADDAGFLPPRRPRPRAGRPAPGPDRRRGRAGAALRRGRRGLPGLGGDLDSPTGPDLGGRPHASGQSAARCRPIRFARTAREVDTTRARSAGSASRAAECEEYRSFRRPSVAAR